MEVNIATILTLIGTIIATIGGKEAWSYYKKKLELKAKVAMHGNHSKDELREEIQEMLERQIQELKENVRLLTKRILDLETERETDKKRIASKNTEIALLRKDSGL
tara:strand:- start:72 stop:389 length:318 start_codon:yes stop_codon:yes gene_type:complete